MILAKGSAYPLWNSLNHTPIGVDASYCRDFIHVTSLVKLKTLDTCADIESGIDLYCAFTCRYVRVECCSDHVAKPQSVFP